MVKHFFNAFGWCALFGSAPISSALGQPLVPAPKAVPALHWAQFPIRVFVYATGASQKQEAQTALAGLDEWVQASREKVRYALVTNPGDADITVRFVPVRFLSTQTGSIGETTVVYSGLTLKRAAIRLAEGIDVPEDLQAAAAHEFGHALGIQGHSADPDDLMYPREILHIYGLDDSVLGEPHTVTAHDFQMLKACYPRLDTNLLDNHLLDNSPPRP